jgi:hypothetical protein
MSVTAASQAAMLLSVQGIINSVGFLRKNKGNHYSESAEPNQPFPKSAPPFH